MDFKCAVLLMLCVCVYIVCAPAGCSDGFINMWSSCFHPGSVTESAHSLGSTGSLPAPDTPMLSANSLLSAHSSKSVPQVPPEPAVASEDSSQAGSESGSGDDIGLDAVTSESPRAGSSSSSKGLFGAEHGEPDVQLIGHGWKLWAHKHVLKSECAPAAAHCAHLCLLNLRSRALQASLAAT